MFHLSMWRERMRNALKDVAEDRPMTPPPPIERQNEFNDAELADGIGTPLVDAAARSELLLGEIIDLYAKLGDRPFEWYRWKTTSDAVLANSYTHPRNHMYEYLRENGDLDGAGRLMEEAVADVRGASSSPIVNGIAVYNLACARANQGRLDEVIKLLEEAFVLRPDIRAEASHDPDLEPVYDDPRFQELVKS